MALRCKHCGGPTGNPDGRQWYCSDACRAEVRRVYKRESRMVSRVRKPCLRCGGEKLRGQKWYCEECRPVALAEAEAKEYERSKAWLRDNPDKRRSYEAKYRDGNREKVNAAVRRWQRENPEEYSAQQRKWRKANPDRLRELAARRNALKRAQFVEDVNPMVVLERDDGECGICGGDVDPMFFHVDHIVPLAKGGEHSYANTQTAHPACNFQKHVKTDYELVPVGARGVLTSMGV